MVIAASKRIALSCSDQCSDECCLEYAWRAVECLGKLCPFPENLVSNLLHTLPDAAVCYLAGYHCYRHYLRHSNCP